MSALQLALLILAVGVVIAVYVLSRRRDAQPERSERREPQTGQAGDTPSAAEQMDLWKAGPRTGFDELGVGEPRVRGVPAPAPEAPAAPDVPPSEKIVALYIAEREGTYIFGPQIHKALNEHGLEFGARDVYHCVNGDHTLFSVASLLKPGTLVPDQANGFSTPGLSVFMVLPGADDPLAAFDHMLTTARALAQSLNAELYDSSRALLSDSRAAALRAEVEAWARQHQARA